MTNYQKLLEYEGREEAGQSTSSLSFVCSVRCQVLKQFGIVLEPGTYDGYGYDPSAEDVEPLLTFGNSGFYTDWVPTEWTR